MDTPDNPGNAQDSEHAAGESPLRERLLAWLEIAGKLAAPMAVVVAAYLGHSLQGSLTTSQMLSQRENSDTTIRAEMFKSISERLFGAKSGAGDLAPSKKAVFTELLALNFHEHIELKPLLLEVDQDLVDEQARLGGTTAEAKQTEKKREELHSIARRVRVRQTASLLRNDSAPDVLATAQLGGLDFSTPTDAGATLKFISVRFNGRLPLAADAKPSRCDVPKGEGTTACVRSPIFAVSPDGRNELKIAVNDADPDRQSVTLSVKHSAVEAVDTALPPLGTPKPECGGATKDSRPDAALAVEGSSSVEFDTTWFDFPLTDNTLLANGERYAIFIDDFCFDEDSGQQAVKLGLLWFPRDYFPARERPTNFRELRRKLGLRAGA
jgi:hypothetical protein